MEAPVYHLEKVVRSRTENREDFNGPLDLILHLLSKNKMEIADIQIALILDQYLAWMDRRKELDLDVASEFVAMAAQLMFIKSRMLLSIKDEEALSEMEELIASLEEHRRKEDQARVRAVLPALDRRFAVGRDYLTKAPEPLAPDNRYQYEHVPHELLLAMLDVLARSDRPVAPPVTAFEGIVGREPYPVAEKARELLARLVRAGVTRFRALFRGDRSRSEIVATFLAVLELCRAHRVLLAGDGECTVTCIDDRPMEEDRPAEEDGTESGREERGYGAEGTGGSH